MKASVSTPAELREETRREVQVQAYLEAPHAVFPQRGPVLIEEASACGLRLRSELQLHPGEALVLRVPGHVLPLHADVVWREEAPARWPAHKTWVAGCRLRPDSVVQARFALPSLVQAEWRPLRARVLAMAVGVIGLLALLVYLYVRFVQWMGGSSQVPH